MKYLTLSADYAEPSLRADDIDGDEVVLPPALRSAIEDWNARYGPIVPMEPLERATPQVAALIAELDREGLDLARQIVAAVGPDARVEYYSEGLLRRLPPEG